MREWRGKGSGEKGGEGEGEVERHHNIHSAYVPPLISSQDSLDTEGSASETSLKLFPGAARRHGRLLASPPMCVPEVQEKTHVKR